MKIGGLRDFSKLSGMGLVIVGLVLIFLFLSAESALLQMSVGYRTLEELSHYNGFLPIYLQKELLLASRLIHFQLLVRLALLLVFCVAQIPLRVPVLNLAVQDLINRRFAAL